MTIGNATVSHAATLAGFSDPGRQRDLNEDAFALLPEAGVALLADGMGGPARGALASALAVSSALRELLDSAPGTGRPPVPPGARLVAAFAAANRALRDGAVAENGAAGLGASLLGVLFSGGRIHVAQVGNARLYRLRDGALVRLTRDQTVGELRVSQDAPHGMLRTAPVSNLPTRALGGDAEVRPELYDIDCGSGDLYLLCSDGLHHMLGDGEIRLTLQKFGANLGAAARELVRLANQRGGLDDITVVLARPITPTDADPGDRTALAR